MNEQIKIEQRHFDALEQLQGAANQLLSDEHEDAFAELPAAIRALEAEIEGLRAMPCPFYFGGFHFRDEAVEDLCVMLGIPKAVAEKHLDSLIAWRATPPQAPAMPDSIAVLRECAAYLDVSRMENIGSGSTLHNKMHEALRAYEAAQEKGNE